MKRILTAAVALLFITSCGKETELDLTIKQFKKGDAKAREAAINKMGAAGDQAKKVVPYVVKGMSDESKEVRLAAIGVLPALKDSAGSAFKKVRELAAEGKDQDVRVAAIHCLVGVVPDDPATGELLLKATEDENPAVSLAAGRALLTKGDTSEETAKALAVVIHQAILYGKEQDQKDASGEMSLTLATMGESAKAAVQELDACVAEAKVSPKVKPVLEATLKVIQGKGELSLLSQATEVMNQ